MSTEPKTGLTYWPAGAIQQDLLFNALLLYVAVWTQPVFLSIENAPPGSPDDGDLVLVGVGTGAFAGHDDELAYWHDETASWLFFAPFVGAEALNLDDGLTYEFAGSAGWSPSASGVQVAIQFQDEGADVGAAGTVGRVDFTGAGVTVTEDSNGDIEVAIPGGGGGGGRTLMGSATISGSPGSTLTVSSLDLDTDLEYEIDINVKGAVADDYARMYYSGDTTDANYRVSLYRELSGSGGGGEFNDARAAYVINGACTVGSGKLKKDVDGKATFVGDCKAGSTTAMTRWIFSQMRAAAAANVTSISLVHAGGSGFAVGSYIKVWKP